MTMIIITTTSASLTQELFRAIKINKCQSPSSPKMLPAVIQKEAQQNQENEGHPSQDGQEKQRVVCGDVLGDDGT